MFDIERYMEELTGRLREAFGERLRYVGLQGSYLRGEAGGDSDIDAMAVIDGLSVEDMDAYRGIIEALGDAERACGFICGTEELRSWNPFEIGHLLRSTRDIYGELAQLVPEYTAEDMRRYIGIEADNLYHMLCHGHIHGSRSKSREKLSAYYKFAFFILQDLHFLRSGEFCETRAELTQALDGGDREIMLTAERLRRGEDIDGGRAFRDIFEWCRGIIRGI